MYKASIAGYYLLLAAAAASLCGCSSRQADPDPPGARAKAYRIVLKTEPDNPAKQLVNTQFTVTVNDREGKAVDGANVFIDLTMPDMAMPPNNGSARPTGTPGEYAWKNAVFTMGGKWQVEVKVTHNDKEESEKFLMEVK